MSGGVVGKDAIRISRVFIGFLAAVAVAGCASRTVVQDEPAPLAANPPRQQAHEPRPIPPPEQRQRVGSGPVWMDDPALRRGPQGQPALYGRDTVTGRPLSELGQNGQPSEPGFARPESGNIVVVARGDTLSAIARRHNVSVDALIRANNLPNDRIREGQRLVIPGR